MATYAQAPRTLWRRAAGGEVVVLAGEAAEVAVLNPTAAAVWAGCARPATFEDLLARLAQAYGEDPAALAGDLRAALERLCDLGVLVASGAG